MPVDMAPPVYGGPIPQIQPPQSDNNFLEMAQRAEQLKTARQLSPYQVASAQAGVQGQQLANQEQQLNIQSQQGLMKAYLAANGDPDKATQLAPQYGVLPKDIMAFRTNMLNMAKTKSEVDKNQQEVLDDWHDTLHNAYAPVMNEADPDKQAQMVWQINSGLLSRYPNKSLSDLVQWTDPNAFKMAMAAYTTDKWTTAQGAVMRGQAAQQNANTATTKEEQAAADALRKNTSAQLAAAATPDAYDQIRDAYLAQKGANAGLFPPSRLIYDQTGKAIPSAQQQVAFAGMNPDEIARARQAADNAAQAALPKTEPELELIVNDPTKPQTLRDAAKAALAGMVQQHNAERPVTNITNVPGLPATPTAQQQQLSGEPYLATLPPGTAAQIRAIAEGRAVMPSAATRSQGALQLRNAVFQFDPSYSDQRAQVRKAFTTGADGRNIGALNTAAVHLDQFADAASALNTGNVQLINQAMNALKAQFGATAPANFQALKTAVAGEMASALKGNATDPEIANVSKAIDAANSPAQLQGVVETNLHVLGAKLNTYQQRYQQQIPGDQVYNPILPAARGVFQKHGFDPTAPAAASNGGRGNAGTGLSLIYQGHLFTFKDAATMAKFKQDQGIK
jgi:hypothetical protein